MPDDWKANRYMSALKNTIGIGARQILTYLPSILGAAAFGIFAYLFFRQDVQERSYPAKVLYNRAGIYAARNDLDGAISDYNEAIRLDPTFAPSFFNRGLTYARRQDYDAAIADFSAAIRLDLQRADAFYNRGNAYLAKKQYDAAIADFTSTIRLNPTAVAFANRGIAYALRQDYDSALADLDEAIRRDPKQASHLRNRAMGKIRKGDWEGGSADMTRRKLSMPRVPSNRLPAYVVVFKDAFFNYGCVHSYDAPFWASRGKSGAGVPGRGCTV